MSSHLGTRSLLICLPLLAAPALALAEEHLDPVTATLESTEETYRPRAVDAGAAMTTAGVERENQPPPGYEQLRRPNSPSRGDDKEGFALLVAAYMAIWLLLFGYILFLWRRQRRLEGEVESLSRLLDQ